MPKKTTKNTPATTPRKKQVKTKLPANRSSVSRIDLSQALKMYVKGISQSEIAKFFNVTAASVSAALKPFKIKDPEMLKAYQENKATVLDNIENSLLAGLTPAKLKRASARDLATCYGIFYDKNRLEQDKSTSNVNTFSRLIVEADDDY